MKSTNPDLFGNTKTAKALCAFLQEADVATNRSIRRKYVFLKERLASVEDNPYKAFFKTLLLNDTKEYVANLGMIKDIEDRFIAVCREALNK